MRYKKKKLSDLLADAVLSHHCTGSLKLILEDANEHEREAIDGYDYYIEGLSEDLHRMIAEHIRVRIKYNFDV